MATNTVDMNGALTAAGNSLPPFSASYARYHNFLADTSNRSTCPDRTSSHQRIPPKSFLFRYELGLELGTRIETAELL